MFYILALAFQKHDRGEFSLYHSFGSTPCVSIHSFWWYHVEEDILEQDKYFRNHTNIAILDVHYDQGESDRLAILRPTGQIVVH